MDDLTNRKNKTSRSEKVLRGLYSSGGNYSLLSVYGLRYKQAIFTLKTALSLYGLTDYFVEPPFSMAFPRGSRICHDDKVEQHFVSSSFFSLGETTINYEGRDFRIYDRERLLIEIMHAKNKLGIEIYKAAIHAYREIVRTKKFSVPKFEEYCQKLKFAKSYMKRLLLEVM
jgi:hypothetical protein